MFLYSSWMKRLSWLPTEEDIEMSLPFICKFVSWVVVNKSDSTGLDELRLQLPVYTLDKIVGTINFRETHY